LFTVLFNNEQAKKQQELIMLPINVHEKEKELYSNYQNGLINIIDYAISVQQLAEDFVQELKDKLKTEAEQLGVDVK
jgi:hypothetical protein